MTQKVESFQQQKLEAFRLQFEINEKLGKQELEKRKAEEEKEKERREKIHNKVGNEKCWKCLVIVLF